MDQQLAERFRRDKGTVVMKLVILEREVLAEADPEAPGGWKPVAGALQALAQLFREGYRFIVTAQLHAAERAAQSVESVNLMHAALLEAVRTKGADIEAFFVCPHAVGTNCNCRKPKPGLFEEIAGRLKINLARVYAVGLTDADAQAAQAADLLPVQIGKAGAGKQAKSGHAHGDLVFEDFSAFAAALLSGQLTNA